MMNELVSGLPVSGIASQVNAMLAEHGRLVVTAPPGAGKSTVLPLTVLSSIRDGKILMLEPRRLAARQVAERMASLIGEPVGETVGYSMRFERKASPRTRVEVVTEGIMTRIQRITETHPPRPENPHNVGDHRFRRNMQGAGRTINLKRGSHVPCRSRASQL